MTVAMQTHRVGEGAAVLAAVCLAGLMMPLSFTAPAVAMPAIMRDLGGDVVTLGWVVNAFVLSFGSTVMAAGALADRFGRKRVFLTGVSLFGLLSVVIGLANSIEALILVRMAQGVAAALAMAGGAASLAQVFAGAARTRAYSLLGTSFGIGLAFGPVLTGLLVDSLGWRSVFLSGVGLTLVSLVLGAAHLPETRDPDARGVDVGGTATFSATLLLLTLGIVEGPQKGWGSATVVGLLAAAVLMLAVFVRVERAQCRPMLDLDLFRYPRFVGVQVLPVATGFSFVVPLVFLPGRFIGVEGYDEVTTGVMMIPLSAPMMVVPFLAALATRWLSAGVLSGAGFVIAAAGLWWLSQVPPGAPAAAFVGPLLVIGLGAGLPWGLMDDLSVSVVPKERAGMATGIFSTMRLAGEAVALASVGALLVAIMQPRVAAALAAGGSGEDVTAAANSMAAGNLRAALPPGLPAAADLQSRLTGIYGDGFSLMLTGLAGVALLAALVSFAVLGSRRDDPAGAR